MLALGPDSPILCQSFGQSRPAGQHPSHYQTRATITEVSYLPAIAAGFGEFQSVPQPRPLHTGYNPQQRPRAGGTRMTYLRVTTIPGRFTEVLDTQVTATGRAVLNRLRSGGRRPGGPGSDYARYRVPGLQPLDNTSDRASSTSPALHQDNGS